MDLYEFADAPISAGFRNRLRLAMNSIFCSRFLFFDESHTASTGK